MLIDPEGYIPVEVARRTELARKAYRAAKPAEPDAPVAPFFDVPRFRQQPTPLA